MTKTTTTEATETALAKVGTRTALEQINATLAEIPTVEDDPTEAMLQLVIDASSPKDWNAIFQSESLRDSAGKRFRLNAYRALKSDFEGGLTHYLVVDATSLETGERQVLTCSSQMAIAQIFNATRRGVWPIDVEIVQKDKPTKAGFRPIHLRYIGPAQAPLGDPSKVVSEQ